ncbi:esterase [Alteromonas lipolytica]|nr:esterase [Alteromonas lipolytica]
MQQATLDGQLRSWRLYMPSSSSAKPLPLVFNFHGTGSSPENISALNQLEQLAGQEHFIVVAPQAEFSYEPGGRKTWNVEQLESPYDDVAFIRALIEHLISQYPIDLTRIYATGFSGGARMSSLLACELATTFAAIAPIAGVRFADNCKPASAMPVLTYHGKKDPVNHYVHQPDSPRYWHAGVEDAIHDWVNHNQCHSVSEENLQAGITKLTWSQCQDDVQVVFYRSAEGGHTWPDSPKAELLAKYGLGKTDNIAMTQFIWTFFRQYQRQSSAQ